MWYKGRLFIGTLEVVIGSVVFYVAFSLLPRKPFHLSSVSVFNILIILGLWFLIGGIINLIREAYKRLKK